jgi:hypothetical protein
VYFLARLFFWRTFRYFTMSNNPTGTRATINGRETHSERFDQDQIAKALRKDSNLYYNVDRSALRKLAIDEKELLLKLAPTKSRGASGVLPSLNFLTYDGEKRPSKSKIVMSLVTAGFSQLPILVKHDKLSQLTVDLNTLGSTDDICMSPDLVVNGGCNIWDPADVDEQGNIIDAHKFVIDPETQKVRVMIRPLTGASVSQMLFEQIQKKQNKQSNEFGLGFTEENPLNNFIKALNRISSPKASYVSLLGLLADETNGLPMMEAVIDLARYYTSRIVEVAHEDAAQGEIYKKRYRC